MRAQTSVICILDFWVLAVSPVNPDEQAKGGQYRQQGNGKAITYLFHPSKSDINTLYTCKNNNVESQSDTSRNERDMSQGRCRRREKKLSGNVQFAVVWHTAPDWYLTC